MWKKRLKVADLIFPPYELHSFLVDCFPETLREQETSPLQQWDKKEKKMKAQMQVLVEDRKESPLETNSSLLCMGEIVGGVNNEP